MKGLERSSTLWIKIILGVVATAWLLETYIVLSQVRRLAAEERQTSH